MTLAAAAPPPAVVLDTNVTLDWLFFADPAVGALAAHIERGELRWLACGRMRDELAEVLTRTPFIDRTSIGEHALTSFDRWTQPCALTVESAAPPLRCADPDDQVFLDLALAHRARWLITRDKALLTLAAGARRHGLEIVAPRQWAAPPPAPE